MRLELAYASLVLSLGLAFTIAGRSWPVALLGLVVALDLGLLASTRGGRGALTALAFVPPLLGSLPIPPVTPSLLGELASALIASLAVLLAEWGPGFQRVAVPLAYALSIAVGLAARLGSPLALAASGLLDAAVAGDLAQGLEGRWRLAVASMVGPGVCLLLAGPRPLLIAYSAVIAPLKLAGDGGLRASLVSADVAARPLLAFLGGLVGL
ncbi:MAG: hypothetical protein ABWK00_02045 [Desulfurococcaceae archaeon]